jgi:hypothetical protein
MFLAGLEIDIPRIRGGPLQRAVVGWVFSLGSARRSAWHSRPSTGALGLIVGLAVTTTAPSTLLPILRDSGELQNDFGTEVLAGAAVGELGPLIAISVLLSTDGRLARCWCWRAIVIVLVAAAVAMHPRSERLARILDQTLTTSGQLAVRLVMLFTGVMVWIGTELDWMSSSALAAGMVFRLFSAGDNEREAAGDAKLQGLGFGSSCRCSSSSPGCVSISTRSRSTGAADRRSRAPSGVPGRSRAPAYLMHRHRTITDRLAGLLLGDRAPPRRRDHRHRGANRPAPFVHCGRARWPRRWSPFSRSRSLPLAYAAAPRSRSRTSPTEFGEETLHETDGGGGLSPAAR